MPCRYDDDNEEEANPSEYEAKIKIKKPVASLLVLNLKQIELNLIY